jgi:hypothetical protein
LLDWMSGLPQRHSTIFVYFRNGCNLQTAQSIKMANYKQKGSIQV